MEVNSKLGDTPESYFVALVLGLGFVDSLSARLPHVSKFSYELRGEMNISFLLRFHND